MARHNVVKADGDRAMIRDNGNVRVGDKISSGKVITEIIRRSRQQGMDLATVTVAWPTKTAAEIDAIRRDCDDSFEEHLRRADRRQRYGWR